MNEEKIQSLLDATGIKVNPGEKGYGYLRVEGFSNEFDVPVVIIRGKNPGPIAFIVAGIHAGEHNSIQGAKKVSMELDPQDVSGAVVVVPLANRSAFHARTHNGSPPDGQDLSNLFPGKAEGKVLERVAHLITSKIIVYCDVVMDLHGADAMERIIPHLYVPEHEESTEERGWNGWDLAEVYGIEVVGSIGSRKENGSAVHAAAARGIPSILPEAGSGFLDEEAIGIHFRGIVNVLRRVGILEGLPLIERKIRKVRYERIPSPKTGFFYSYVAEGQEVFKGQVVGEVTDYFGRERVIITSHVTGHVDFIKLTMATNEGNGLYAIVVDED